MIYVLRFVLIVLYTVFWAGLACLVAPLDRSGERVIWIARRWMDWILRACRVEVEASGLEHLDPSQPYVLMTNHQSAFDVVALVATLPVSFRFVGKRELLWIPLLGWALGMSGHIIIDRQNRERAVRSLRRAAARIRRGINVIIFPEGTRSPTGALGPFKSGGFHLAIEAQVPIVPITVSGSRRITPKGSLRIESGRIHIHYGEPIPTEKLAVSDRHELKERVREAILEGFDPELQGAD